MIQAFQMGVGCFYFREEEEEEETTLDT